MNELIGSNAAAIRVDQSTGTIAPAASSLRLLLPSLAAALLGVVIIAGVGFAPGVAHDAAHDVRHTMTFPCH